MKGITLENEYAYISEGKVFLKGYMDMPDRQIGEVKSTEEEAIDYFVRRFEIADSKVNQLEADIESAQNKGSYLTKLIQLRKRLLNFDGIGNFIPLLEKLDVLEKELVMLIEKNQLDNLDLKRQMIEEASQYKFTENWKASAAALQEIRSKWIRTGPVPRELIESIEHEFKEIYDNFYQARKAFFDEQNKVIDQRVQKYNELIAKANELFHRTDWDEAFLDLKNLQTEWKIVGEVPQKLLRALYKNFQRPTSGFYAKYCEAKGIQPKKRRNPRLEAQKKMVLEAEQLTQSENIYEATKRAKELLNMWKGVRVPAHIADRELAERFRSACDKIFELSYLHKVVSRKYPTFQFLSEKQKDLTRYREMGNIFKRAQNDFNELLASQKDQMEDEDMARVFQSSLRTQRRKLKMKELILAELKEKASDILNY